MLNKIIYYSLHNRLVVLFASLLLFGTGIYTSLHTEVDVFPDLNAPTVVVMTEAGGMAAEEVEQLVTFPLETAVNGASGVRRVRSSSTAGFSIIWVEFDWGTDIYLARQIVSEKMAVASESLPQNISKPVLGPQSSILGEILIVSLTADSTSMLTLRTLADKVVRPRLLSTGGVAQVAVLGGDVKEYQIQLSPERMRHYGVSIDEALQASRGLNRNVNGGVHYEYGNEYIVRGVLSTQDTKELGQAVVKKTAGGPILLRDVADIVIAAKEPRLGTASEKGLPAVLLTVTKQPATSTTDLTDKLLLSINDIQKNLPHDIKVSTDVFRQSRFIESAIDNVKKSLFEGSLFVIIVLFLFLSNVRTTLISLVAMPLSLLISLLTLHYMGLTINTMSLGGLAIAIGSLVDDAIVDVENVFRHLRENNSLPPEKRKPLRTVVYDASREVRTPILNSTFIIIVSFVPLFFLSGMEGRMLIPLGVAFIVALFASTAVALTLTPVLCSYLPQRDKKDKAWQESRLSLFIKREYGKALAFSLSHTRSLLLGVGALLVVSVGLFFTLGHSFLPPFNEGSFTINVSSLPGISLEESDRIGRKAEELLLEIPEITTVARKTGRAELDEHALGVNVSEIEAPFVLKERSRKELVAAVREKLGGLSGVNVEIGQPISHRIDAMLSGTKANIAIKIFGDDLNRLFSLGNQAKEAIEDIPGVADLNVEQQISRPQLQITPRREMLSQLGITLPQFSQAISVALLGETVSLVQEGDRQFDLVLKMNGEAKGRIEDIRNLMLDTGDGKKVPLSSIADITSTMGPNSISRENVKRKIVVSANVDDRDLGSVVEDIQKKLSSTLKLPEGYHIEYGGQFESEQAASRTLLLTSLLSILIIFLLLYHEFRSTGESLVVLLNLPLALIGGVFALLLTGGEVSIPAIIGFISLFGIATRNGLLLISHYHHLQREKGLDLYHSVMQGSLARLSPILMTALTSAFALIPLAVAGDLSGNEIQSPMAKVILGGLLSSTLLNGFVIPMVYLMMHANDKKKKPVQEQL